ncbi:hypothetical protein ACFL67_02110 [candidate division KSB1 bacterium]
MNTSSEECSVCHSLNYCQECHDGAALASTQGAKANPNAPSNWGVNNLILAKNHDLNYKFTHALEAKSKLENCVLCHDQETFCVDCHETSLAANGFKPLWHGGPEWGAMALARGSGGGQHARMAKQDISRCSACHDANGEDPTCLLCHMDRTPGKFNDLRTHSNNNYKSVMGPWHGDKNYMCFTCHVNAQSNDPVGFCGYCHGIR